ncbi:MAG: lysostaphin resistance A-like protein [Planctomycetota bacterium]
MSSHPPGLAVSPVLAAAVTLLAWLVVSSLAMLILGASANGAAAPVLIALGGQAVGSMVALAAAFGFRAVGVPLAFPRLTWTAVARLVSVYLGFLVLWVPIAFVLVPWVWQRLGWAIEPQAHLAWFAEEHTATEVAFAFAAVAILGPWIEEVIFRGFLQTGLQRRFGRVTALAITAVVFGLLHVPNGTHLLIPIALLGALFGVLRESSGGLSAAILAHAIHNGLTVALVLTRPEWLMGTFER